jgi:hypothetical protein
MSVLSTITLTFTSCDVSDGSCSFNDGTKIYTISSISPGLDYTYGKETEWYYNCEINDFSGNTIFSSQQFYVSFYEENTGFYALTMFKTDASGINLEITIISNSDSTCIYLSDANSGKTFIPLNYVTASTAIPSYIKFNNDSITPNSKTSPSSWTFSGGESSDDYSDISGNTSGSTSCIMTFYSYVSTAENIQNVGIVGSAAGVYELIQGTSSKQTLTNGYIASMACLLYSWYGIYE